MDRDKKNEVVDALSDSFARAKIAVVAEYRGLKVSELEKLRRSLREQDAQIRVAKNTLLRIAVKDTPYDNLSDTFSGSTAVAVGFTEPVGPAKALTAFAKEYGASFTIRGAGLEGSRISAEDLLALSKLPGREELLGKLLGAMTAVPTSFVRVLNAVPQKFMYALTAIKEQKENQ